MAAKSLHPGKGSLWEQLPEGSRRHFLEWPSLLLWPNFLIDTSFLCHRLSFSRVPCVLLKLSLPSGDFLGAMTDEYLTSWNLSVLFVKGAVPFLVSNLHIPECQSFCSLTSTWYYQFTFFFFYNLRVLVGLEQSTTVILQNIPLKQKIKQWSDKTPPAWFEVWSYYQLWSVVFRPQRPQMSLEPQLLCCGVPSCLPVNFDLCHVLGGHWLWMRHGATPINT